MEECMEECFRYLLEVLQKCAESLVVRIAEWLLSIF